MSNVRRGNQFNLHDIFCDFPSNNFRTNFDGAILPKNFDPTPRSISNIENHVTVDESGGHGIHKYLVIVSSVPPTNRRYFAVPVPNVDCIGDIGGEEFASRWFRGSQWFPEGKEGGDINYVRVDTICAICD